MVGLETPGVEADGDVVDQRVGASKIKIDKPGKLVAKEKHIIWKQVGVNDALRQSTRPLAFQDLQLGADQRFQIAVDLMCSLATALVELAPAGNRKRIAAPHRKIPTGEMQSRQRFAKRAAMGRARAANPHAVEEGDDRGRAAGKLAEYFTGAIFHRLRTVDAATCQMLHQT